MRQILALAQITWKEGLRNRALLGIFFFSLLLFGLNISVAGFFTRDVGKVTVDMNLSTLSFAGLLLTFFIGVNLIAKDIDRKTVHLVLSKPISRIQYIWGKYLGILAFIFVSLSILVLFSSATIFLLKSLYPNYFPNFLWVNFFIGILFVFVKIAVLNSIVILFSSLTTNSFIALIFSILFYVVGETVEEVVFYLKAGVGESSSQFLHNMIDFISYIAPNLSAFNFQGQAAHGLPITQIQVLFPLGYAVTYIVALLMLASLAFSRREFN